MLPHSPSNFGPPLSCLMPAADFLSYLGLGLLVGDVVFLTEGFAVFHAFDFEEQADVRAHDGVADAEFLLDFLSRHARQQQLAQSGGGRWLSRLAFAAEGGGCLAFRPGRGG